MTRMEACIDTLIAYNPRGRLHCISGAWPEDYAERWSAVMHAQGCTTQRLTPEQYRAWLAGHQPSIPARHKAHEGLSEVARLPVPTPTPRTPKQVEPGVPRAALDQQELF